MNWDKTTEVTNAKNLGFVNYSDLKKIKELAKILDDIGITDIDTIDKPLLNAGNIEKLNDDVFISKEKSEP